MPAVSAEFPHAPASDGTQPPGADFGPNEWLVDELYQRYQADPGSVDRAWWNFFADYQPDQPRPAVAAPADRAECAP